MRNQKILMAIVLCVIIAVGVSFWIGRYSMFYHYYLWRLNRATEESVIMDMKGNIESIAPHVVPSLIHTYEDTSSSERSKTAAAIGLMRADKNRAETLFLENNDNEIYPALYYYYLWLLNHTVHGSVIMDQQENIESIASHIVPLLVRTYEDVNAPGMSRHAAAYGLIEADKKRAEDVFIPFLDNKDDEIVALAILDLAIAESDKPFERITGFVHHPSAEIRRAVATYLGSIGNDESISLLKKMMENDPDADVRSSATFQLQELGVLPRH